MNYTAASYVVLGYCIDLLLTMVAPFNYIVNNSQDGFKCMSPAFHIRSRAELPVYRPINNLAVRVRVASQYGVDDPMALLEGTGIKTSDLDDPDSIITTLQYLKVAKRFTEMIPVPGINLELGMHIHLAVKGKLGMAAMCCSTVMEALELLIKYIDLAPSNFQYEIWTEGVYSTGSTFAVLVGF